MAQQIINTGAAANDGTGDPLRTAFTETNNNFTEIYTAGPVGSNVQIANNTILTLNTNGNLVLAPNGTGRVVANVDVVPNRANVRNLGSATARWSTVYAQYLNVTNSTTVAGDLTVGGNLTVTGNTVQIGNLVTDAKTLQLANTANTANAATGSGITVGAADNIATLLYNNTGNVWTTNIGVSAVGNITAPYFIGNGSQLTGLPVPYGNANVATFLAAFGSNTISTTGNTTAGYFIGNGSQLANITANSTQVTYLQGDAGSVQRTVASKFQETASVKDFGAVGDGVTNDTAAITAAITATTSGTLIFPEGSYLINNSTGPFTVSSFQGEMIFLGNAKLLFNTNTQAGIVFSGGSNAKIYNIRIDYVTPPTSRTNAQEGIAFYSTTDTTVTGVYVESSPAAGLLFGQCIRPQVSGVVIESSQADGVHFNNCQDPQIDNLITVSTGDDGLAFVNYASQANYSGGTATNIIIRNSKSRGIAVVGQSNVTVSNFLVDGTASSGIFTAYDSAYSTRYPANVIWSDGIVRNAGTVTPLVGNQFGIEYANVVSVKYNNIKVINSASRGMSGTTTANGLVEASDITVDSATTNNGFNLSGDNISIDNLFANNIQSYGIYISNSTNVQATNLKTLNVSKGGGLNRAVWFDTVVQLLADGIEVIDNQGSATGYIVGSASCTRGSVSSVNFAIANGTGQINPVGSGISYPLTNYGPNSTNILFGTGTISGTGNITAGNIIANNVGNIASINLNGNANTVLYGNGVFAAAAASSSYGNANVATFLAAYGSNTISTSGNITAGNVSTGRITLTNGAVIKDTAVGSVAFGQNAGLTSQGAGAVAIGGSAGQTTQGIYAVAIGTTAGNTTQGIGAVAIGGISAGGNLQGDHAVAIGTSSGSSGQGISAVAIGISAGGTTQGDSAVAIGNSAGYTGQGTYAVAVGSLAGLTNQANNSIILNATGANLNATTANTFTVAPVRNDVANIGNVMFYNATSKEITYGNVISVAGNITGGNISATNHTGTTVSVTGNITAANFFGNGNTLSNVATRFESSWTVPTGNSTQSFTVATSETYYLWVDCNISNGILVWNATATVTNTNVPVVGAQYAWVYSGGGLPVDFTSIPNQFIGTADTIVRSNVAPSATTNRFDFGINNTSGGNITVRYGWVAIS